MVTSTALGITLVVLLGTTIQNSASEWIYESSSPIESPLTSPLPLPSPRASPWSPESPVAPFEPYPPTWGPTMPGPTASSPIFELNPPMETPSLPVFPYYPSSPITYPPEPISREPFSPVHRPKPIKAAYWPTFTGFPASSIDSTYFTHIYYAFLLLEPSTYKLSVTTFDQGKLLEFTSALRGKTPTVKTMLSIGGAGENATLFSLMASNKTTRATFIYSTIEVARKYEFDGLDLDWEFPANDQDMENLGLLFRQWRKSLTHEARIAGRKRLLLSTATYFASKLLTYVGTPSYPSEIITRYVDWINPMCFDYHGSWQNFTGLHSALYDSNTNFSTSYGIRSWIQTGLPVEKIVMGMPLYGRSWNLVDPNNTSVGAPAIGNATVTYSEIIDLNTKDHAVIKLDSDMVGYYSYSGDYWIGFDDVRTVKFKVQFARLLGLRGYFFWALGQDRNWIISKQASKSWDC
ncbi:hypothetical protein ACFE04_019218 [Oxalis oulophora]